METATKDDSIPENDQHIAIECYSQTKILEDGTKDRSCAEELFTGVSTRFGLLLVEKYFENYSPNGLFERPKSSHECW